MLLGMPVLGQYDMAKSFGQFVDDRHDLMAGGDGKITARDEIILDIDDEEDIGFEKLHAVLCCLSPRSRIISSRMMNFCGLPVTVIGSASLKRT